MNFLTETREQLATARRDAERLLDAAQLEHRGLTDAERQTFDELETKITRLREREAELADAAERQNAQAAVPVFRRSPDDSAHLPTSSRDQALWVLERSSMPDQLRSAALEAVERYPGHYSARAAVTGTDDYLRAFCKIARDPERGHLEWTPAETAAFQATRAMNVGTGSAGGYAVPFVIDPQIVVTGAGAVNPMRQVARQVVSPANNWHGITAGQISASWDGEATAVSDDSPTLVQPTIALNAARAFIPVSFEMFEDVTTLGAEVAMLFADARNNLEAAAFTTGSGSSNEPTGIITAVGAVTASRVSPTTGGTFGLPDLYAVQNAIPARHSAGATWMASLTVLNKARRFGEGTTGSNSAYWADLSAGTPAQLLGRPIVENSSMTSATTTGSNVLIYGDFSKYYIVDHAAGASVEFIPNLFDTSTGRPTSQRAWLLHWRTGAGVVDADAFRLLRL